MYNILPTYEWSGVYGTTSVDGAVTTLSAVVQDNMRQAIPSGSVTKSEFPNLFASSLRYYIRKKLLLQKF
jgi:hypothetical protein